MTGSEQVPGVDPGAKTLRQRVITVLKLVAVIGLLYWVFQSVQWGDVQRLKREEVVVVETAGKIVGDWRGDTVEFRAEGDDGELGQRDDGAHWAERRRDDHGGRSWVLDLRAQPRSVVVRAWGRCATSSAC